MSCDDEVGDPENECYLNFPDRFLSKLKFREWPWSHWKAIPYIIQFQLSYSVLDFLSQSIPVSMYSYFVCFLFGREVQRRSMMTQGQDRTEQDDTQHNTTSHNDFSIRINLVFLLGPLSAQTRPTLGSGSAHTRPTLSPRSAHSRLRLGSHSVQAQPRLGPLWIPIRRV